MTSPIPAGGDEIGELVAAARDAADVPILRRGYRARRAASLLPACATALEQLQRERDAALAEIERMIPQFVAYEYLESPARADIAEAALTAANARISALEAQAAASVEMVDAVKTLLYTDEVFVGSHWEGDFRDPQTKVWPVFCAHFPNYGADAEEIPEADIVPLAESVREFGSDAVSAWVCAKRGLDDPPKGRLSPKGREALAAIRSRSSNGVQG